MKIKLLIIVGVVLFSSFGIRAQNGGKAEPNRVKFAKGKSSTVLSGTLKKDEQMEYIFSAKQGQKITAKIVSTAPKGKFHYFKIEGVDGVNYLPESDINYELDFTAPQTGDYEIFVQMKPTERVRSGKYALTLIIK